MCMRILTRTCKSGCLLGPASTILKMIEATAFESGIHLPLLLVQAAVAQLDADQPLRLGPLHYIRKRLMDDLYDAAMAVEDVTTALRAAMAVVPYYRTVYPKVRNRDPADRHQ